MVMVAGSPVHGLTSTNVSVPLWIVRVWLVAPACAGRADSGFPASAVASRTAGRMRRLMGAPSFPLGGQGSDRTVESGARGDQPSGKASGQITLVLGLPQAQRGSVAPGPTAAAKTGLSGE